MRIPLARWVAPFGDPGINDRSHLPRAFRSVPRPSSPLSAKASTRCPYLRLIPGGTFVPPHKTAAHRGKTPTPKRPHMKTLLRTHPARLRRACPPRSHDKLSLHPSNNARAPGCPGSRSLDLLQTPVVEVNGIEPMTSCLQSRRSPS